MMGQYATIVQTLREIAYSIMATHENSIDATVPTGQLRITPVQALHELLTKYTFCL